MELPNEIAERIIYFGGPIVAAKLSMTSQYMRRMHRTYALKKATNQLGTVIIFAGPRWARYWDVGNWIIYFMNTDNIIHTQITIESKLTGAILKATLTHKMGEHSTESRTVSYRSLNSGLIQSPHTSYYHFNFTLDGIKFELGITQYRIDNYIANIHMGVK